MRDIIWTIIGIWILWKIIDAFRSYSSSKSSAGHRYNQRQDHYQDTTQETSQKPPQKKGELKPDAGEYVDYEEIK
jgi:hypothetical protein